MHLRTSVCRAAVVLVGSLGCTAPLADQMFISLSGIPGDSTDVGHKGEIDVLSYSVGVTATTSWTSGGGAGVGKPNPGELNFSAAWDRSAPEMLRLIASGKFVPTVVLTVRSGNPPNQDPSPTATEYAKYTFESVFLTSVGQRLDGAGRAVNVVSGVYRTMMQQHFAPGSPVPVTCTKWDVQAFTVTAC